MIAPEVIREVARFARHGPDWAKPERIVVNGAFRPLAWSQGGTLALTRDFGGRLYLDVKVGGISAATRAGLLAAGVQPSQIWMWAPSQSRVDELSAGVPGAGLVTAVAIVSFDSLGQAALAPIVYLTATTIEGQFVTPVLLFVNA